MKKGQTDRLKFHFLTKSFYFPDRSKLKQFILKEMTKQGRDIEAINFIFCGDEYLLQINQQYLNHNTYTDIVTFELSPKNQPLLSDIYISVERIKENASLFKTSFKKELHRVIFHGILHLLGFKDKSAKDIELMRTNEETLLKAYFVPRGTARH